MDIGPCSFKGEPDMQHKTIATKTLLASVLGERAAGAYAGSLAPLFDASDARNDTLLAALELVRRWLDEELRQAPCLDSPRRVTEFLRVQYAGVEREIFMCLFLDNRHQLISAEQMFMGTIDGASVHPREVVKRALQLNASAVIFAHNHPSGVADPSQADELITLRLKDALAIVDIRTLDHLVVGGSRVTSFAEKGLI
jgi:DNA repair protein RadC